MRRTVLFLFSILLAAAATGCTRGTASRTDGRSGTVVVYTYDSFAGEWGPGPELAERFKAASGLTLELVDCGEALQALNRAILEKDDVQADVVLGIDGSSADRARQAGIFVPYTPKDATAIVAPHVAAALGDDGLFTPYDYGYFALIYDTRSSVPAPTSLQDLTQDVYRKKIIVMDPRTSTPGIGFLAWTRAAFPDDAAFREYWAALRPNLLAMTGGWSEGWGMFLAGEAPLVVSYTTSPAYNVQYEDDDHAVALIFPQGHVMQAEGCGLLKGAPNPDGARAFMDFLLSADAQETLPLTQWMYPVNADVPLPESYRKAAPVPETVLPVDAAATSRAVSHVISILEG